MTGGTPSPHAGIKPGQVQVRLSATLLRRIRLTAERAYPDEGCGLLVGRRAAAGLRITEVVDSANIAEPPRRDRFEVDPAVRLALMRRLRGSDETIVGHWHSHPDGPALPSDRDAAMAFEPELVWVVVAVHGGRATEVAAFLYETPDTCFRPLPIIEET